MILKLESPDFQKIGYIIAFKKVIITQEIKVITFERLLCNIRGVQEVLVINNDNELTYYGVERVLRKRNAHWLDYLVTNIFLNEKNQIEIHISDEI